MRCLFRLCRGMQGPSIGPLVQMAQFIKDSLERVYNGFQAQDIQSAPVGWHDVMVLSLSLSLSWVRLRQCSLGQNQQETYRTTAPLHRRSLHSPSWISSANQHHSSAKDHSLDATSRSRYI